MKTLKHKIAVMQYAADGGKIVCTSYNTKRSGIVNDPETSFDWYSMDYNPAPDEDGWVANLGFAPEIPYGKKVQYRCKDSYSGVSSPSDLLWEKLGNVTDVTYYRIIDAEPEEPVAAPTKVRVAVWCDRTDGRITHVAPDRRQHKDLHTHWQWELLGYETKELIDD